VTSPFLEKFKVVSNICILKVGPINNIEQDLGEF
jgi:hypothetical protein